MPALGVRTLLYVLHVWTCLYVCLRVCVCVHHSGQLYEKNANTDRFEVLTPKRTSLRHRVPEADEHMLSFIAYLLQVDPHKRPSAQHALQHPWFNVVYNE